MIIIILSLGIIFLLLYVNYGDILKFLYIFKKVNEFPGKKGYPILGNILEFLGPPEYAFRELASFMSANSRDGIASMWLSFLPYVMVTEPDVVELILRNPVNNKKGITYNVLRPWLNDGLLVSEGEKWHSRRKMLTPAFHFNALQEFLPVFNRESRNFVDTLKDHIGKETDVMSIVSKFTLDSICETTMGSTLSEQLEEGVKYRTSVHEFGLLAVERVYKTWLMIDSFYRFSKSYSKQVKVLDMLHGFSKQMIEQRKKSLLERGGETSIGSSKRKMAMLDLLISAQKGGENIDDDGIREEVDTFVFEGHDTTAVSLSFSLMLFANNRECQDKVYQELQTVFGNDDRDPTHSDLQELRYLDCCIKESLRLYPSVPKIAREVGDDIVLKSGHVIPKNCPILIFIYDMHRRADLYPNPEKFEPDRFLLENTIHKHPYSYIPFSAGPRNCIGQKFAMLEMKCLLAAVLRKYILEPIDTPQTVQCVMDMVLRTKDPIRVKFTPRTD